MSFPAPTNGNGQQQAMFDGSFLPSSAPVSSLLPQIGGATSIPAVTNVNPVAAAAALQALLAQAAPALHHSTFVNAALAAPLLAAQPPPVPMSQTLSSANVHNNWSLEQLEQHVAVLQQLNQQIPQHVMLMLHDARKRATKRHAKRIANRKSACTSRARKKALVQEMTELNAKLKRQALILSLLPDLVIVLDREGNITFCSAQVERELQHKVDDLVGAKLTDILMPDSRDAMKTLVRELTVGSKSTNKKQRKKDDSKAAAAKSSASSSKSRVVTEESDFPLSVVKLDHPADVGPDENDISDTSASNAKQPSSLTNSSMGNSGSDDNAASPKKSEDSKLPSKKTGTSSDSSNSTDSSSDAKNLISANANLERNVRWHNQKMKEKGSKFKDDVTGAAVTANNATARLSSLQHHLSRLHSSSGLLSCSEDDSGYRESNDSREEETSSSDDGENMSESKGNRRPIAPTCSVCLVRNDLTTVWCEVTSSIRTKQEAEEDFDDTRSNKPPPSAKKSEDERPEVTEENGPVEILLCLRPIREGEVKADEAKRFLPNNKKLEERLVSEDTGQSSGASELVPVGTKRVAAGAVSADFKRQRTDDTEDTVVAESLVSIMSMTRNK